MPEEFDTVMVINELSERLSIAMSKKTSDAIFNRMKRAFDTMKESGAIERIGKRWNVRMPKEQREKP
jgi:hypothetical protein